MIVVKLLDDRRVFVPQEDRSWTFSRRAPMGKALQGSCYRRYGVPNGIRDWLPARGRHLATVNEVSAEMHLGAAAE